MSKMGYIDNNHVGEITESKERTRYKAPPYATYYFRCEADHQFVVEMDASLKVDTKVPCPVFDCYEDTELQV